MVYLFPHTGVCVARSNLYIQKKGSYFAFQSSVQDLDDDDHAVANWQHLVPKLSLPSPGRRTSGETDIITYVRERSTPNKQAQVYALFHRQLYCILSDPVSLFITKK
jgi:hypothetical protein